MFQNTSKPIMSVGPLPRGEFDTMTIMLENPMLVWFSKFQKTQVKPISLVELESSSKNDFTSRFHKHTEANPVSFA